MHRTRNAAWGQLHRGFESLSLRHISQDGFAVRVLQSPGIGLPLQIRRKSWPRPEGGCTESDKSGGRMGRVAATIGGDHQYPNGLVLYLGTLSNRVNLSTKCPPWTYGASHLLRDLAKADLL